MTGRPFVVVLLPLLLGSCAFLSSIAQKPTVTLKRVDIKEVSFQGLSVDFVLAVTNPNPIGVDLATLSYQITVDGHQFVAGSTSSAVHVPASGLGEVHVPLSIQWVALAHSLDDLFRKRNVAYTLATTLGFGTPIGVLQVPLSTSGTFPVPQLPDVHFTSAGVGNLNISGADLTILLGVRNTNAFAVPLGNIQYQVSLAGAPVVSSGKPVGTVAANATSPVAITAHLDFLSLGMGVFKAIQSRSAEIALDGQLDLAVYRLPLHLKTRLQ